MEKEENAKKKEKETLLEKESKELNQLKLYLFLLAYAVLILTKTFDRVR